MQENDNRMRNYFLKSANRNDFSPTEMETDTELSALETPPLDTIDSLDGQTRRKVRVIDRFSIIL